MRKTFWLIACCVFLIALTAYLTNVVSLRSISGSEEYYWETQGEQDERVKKLREEFDFHLNILKEIKEETTLKLESIRVRLDGGQSAPVTPSCGKDVCFNFYYFTGEDFDTENSKRKNILYISGGPGQILTFDDRALGRLEKEHNVVYFHLRGSGLSVIPPSNTYDKYLRADYAIEDIEKVRVNILETKPGPLKPWDAIYGYSYGTILAQRYARKYPKNVSQLVLHAPVFRNRDTDKARSNQLRSNLNKLYRLIRSKESTSCSCTPIESKSMKIKVDGVVSPNDNLCFLEPTSDVKAIDRLVERIVEEHDKIIDKHGALGFVVENFERFKKLDSPAYPDEFYFALRKLQLLGAPQSEKSLLNPGEIERLVDAAIVLGYYASLDNADLVDERNYGFNKCSITAPFFRNAPEESCKNSVYCQRLSEAKERLRKLESRSEPPRALYVLGLLDGIQHWIPRVLREDGIRVRDESCPKGEDLIQFGKSNREPHKLLREIGKKVGIVPSDKYCLWDPKKFYHEVRTLIVTGGADLVTAGCQAEDFFDHGLVKWQRMLLEFPGWGHESVIPLGIIRKFLTQSTQDEFRQAIRDDLTTLGGADRTPNDGTQFECTIR